MRVLLSPASLAAVAVAAAGVAVARANATSVTLYRITPRNYTGITNLDTGDAAGDAFFGLYEMSAPVVCNGTSQRGASTLLCTNEPLLQIPGFNVYIRVDVEVDDRFGCVGDPPVADPKRSSLSNQSEP
jgi:hypothetical protein